jgi:alpha-beta hydrolase superfamily lysophospholipase
MPKINEFFYSSSDGKSRIHAMEWVPEEVKPVAVLQIAHGVAEYIGRYDAFARYLADQGIVVVGNDHLGHGQSTTATPVFFGQQDGWTHVVDDIYGLHQRVKKNYPHLPYFLMGHSMGSFLARTYLIRYPGTVDGAIIMGTGWQSGTVVTAGSVVGKCEANRLGRNGVSPLVNHLGFGPYNKPFAPNRTEFDWLSADTDNVDRYIANPLCGQPTTVGLFLDMLEGFKFNQNPKNLARMDKDMPVLFISGANDPVGEAGKGVRRSCDAFKAAGMKKVSLKLYDGLRHEILNEQEKETVYADLYQWLHDLIG